MYKPNDLPANFLGAPTPPHRHGQAARVVEPLPRLAPAAPVELQLTVRRSGDVTLYKALLGRLPRLKAGGPVDVVPPLRRGGTWHLDTRATARHRLPKPGNWPRFSIPAPNREHFLVPAIAATPGEKGGAQGTAGYRDQLVFELGPEVAGHPGYYQLLPPLQVPAACPAGHAYTPDNTYYHPARARVPVCRLCERERDARRRNPNRSAHENPGGGSEAGGGGR